MNHLTILPHFAGRRPARPCVFLSAALLLTLFSTTVVQAIPEIKVRHVLVRKKSVAEEALNEFLDRGAKREDFVHIARKYSFDHPTKGAGGDLGWNTPQKFVKEFADEAFGLEPGEFTFEPVRTEFGWHLIYVEQKRDTRDKQKVVRGAMGPEDPEDPEQVKAALEAAKKSAAAEAEQRGKTDATVQNTSTETKPTATDPVATVKPVAQPKPVPTKPAVAKSTPAKLRLRKKDLRVSLEPLSIQVDSKTAIQLLLTLHNFGEDDLKIFHPDVLVLGLKVRSDQLPRVPSSDWQSVPEPETFVVTLKSGEIVGRRIVLNDYFPELTANNRLWVSWDNSALLTNLRSRFAGKIATAEGFGDAESTMKMSGGDLRRQIDGVAERIGRPYRKQEAPVSIWDIPKPGAQYFARITVLGATSPLWFKLETNDQAAGVNYFASLAMHGYYDNLSFYDIRKGEHLIGGCSRNDGTGMPARLLPIPKNRKKIKHVSGTLSLLTRPKSKGTGREAGSIFFVCLDERPKWDGKHLPIGKLVDGKDALESLQSLPSAMIQTVTVVPAELAPERISGINVASGDAAATPDAGADAPAAPKGDEPEILTNARAHPRVELTTSKGKIVVELYENDAANTVNNFVSLVEKSTFPTKDGGKEMKILERADGYYVRTGSPDNSQTGGAGYKIKSEVAENSQRHEKGTLSMCLEVGEDGKEIPNTASSQFFICLDAIGYWDGRYTPFGKVLEGLEVLESLTDQDSITATRVLAKRRHPYLPKARDGAPVE